MKTTIILPVNEDEAALPELLRALHRLRQKDAPELLLIDGTAGGAASALLTAFASTAPRARVLRAKEAGLAPALNRGLSEAKGEELLFLDGATIPEPGWLRAMSAALASADCAVGDTTARLPRLALPHTKATARLFRGRGQRTARAEGYTLPWGAAHNFGARRGWFQRIGGFAPAAGAACDMDWCWRAVLAGARFTYAAEAVAERRWPADPAASLRLFEALGRGEAWVHRAYSFLLEEASPPDPVLVAHEAYLRVRRYSAAAKQTSLIEPLEELAAAFAAGVRLGYEGRSEACGLRRELPKKAVAWESGRKALTVFVPGRGLATLAGKGAEFYEAYAAGADRDALEALFRKLFKVSTHEAQAGAEEFLAALRPPEASPLWTKVESPPDGKRGRP